MKQITLDSGEYLLVDKIPEDAKIHGVFNHTFPVMILYSETIKRDTYLLPPGKWKMIGKCSEITEDEWKGVVAKLEYGFYLRYPSNDTYTCATATESGHSLIESYGMKPQGTLILKKEK